jgi:hypothetical protein
MVVPRQRPSHRIRNWASGLTRPTKVTADPVQLLPPPQGPQPLSDLARFFAGFDPYQDEEPLILPVPEIRLRSAPWNVISDDASVTEDEDVHEHPSISDEDSLQDSIWVNLLARRRERPTHYIPTEVPPIPPDSPLGQTADQWIRNLIQEGASLPPPLHAPRCFQSTPVSPLMDQVITHLKSQGILQPQRISSAYRCFLVPKGDRSARFVIDLSHLTAL